VTTDRVAGVVFAILALAIALYCRTLAFGTVISPGPGLYPLLLAGLLFVASAALVVSTFYSPPRTGDVSQPVATKGHVWPLVVAGSALVLFLILFPLVGLAAAAVIFLAILFRNGGMNWPRVVVLCLTIGIGTELACRAMKIPLPETWIQTFWAGA
jgi:hypothetical protein